MPHILVIDSGVGGLSIVRSILELVPLKKLSYVTDTAYFPYGEKESASLEAIVSSILQLALDRLDYPDIIVIACNTASTQVLHHIRLQTSIPVVGVVPAIKPAGLQSVTGVFGVLATTNTINSQYLQALKAEHCPTLTMRCHGSSVLVQLAQACIHHDVLNTQIDSVVQELQQLVSQEDGDLIDTLVLACTHFPLLSRVIQKALPFVTTRSVQLVDSARGVALQVDRVLSHLLKNTVHEKNCKNQLVQFSFYDRHEKYGSIIPHRHERQFMEYLVVGDMNRR